jgi:hypothetical protein
MMQAATKAEPKMWGPSIVGFGNCRWVYPSGKEMAWMQIAFSPRKANITLYLTGEVLKSDLKADPGDGAAAEGGYFLVPGCRLAFSADREGADVEYLALLVSPCSAAHRSSP